MSGARSKQNTTYDDINKNPAAPGKKWLDFVDETEEGATDKVITDRNLRGHRFHDSVTRAFYKNSKDKNWDELDRFYIYKWGRAVQLEFECAEAIAGSSTMLNMNTVLAPTFHPQTQDNSNFVLHMWKDLIKKITAEQIKQLLKPPTAAGISGGMVTLGPPETSPPPGSLSPSPAARGSRPAGSGGSRPAPDTTAPPGAVPADLPPVFPRDDYNVTFDNIQHAVRKITEQQKSIHSMTPLAWNALSDAVTLCRQTLLEEGVNIDKFKTEEPYEASDKFKLSDREMVTVFSRHPLTASHISRTAGAILQSSLNLRDGAYSGVRKMNANESRMIGYILLFKSEMRQRAGKIDAMLKNLEKDPHSYVEYFLDIDVPFYPDYFGDFIVKEKRVVSPRVDVEPALVVAPLVTEPCPQGRPNKFLKVNGAMIDMSSIL
eukprot:148272-Hanusia_phi.AAC.7